MKKRNFENCLSNEKRIYENNVVKYRKLNKSAQAKECVVNVPESGCVSQIVASGSASGGIGCASVFDMSFDSECQAGESDVMLFFGLIIQQMVDQSEWMAQNKMLREVKVSVKKIEHSLCRMTGEVRDNELDDIAGTLPFDSIGAVLDMEEKLQNPEYVQAMTTYCHKMKGASEDIDSVMRKLFSDQVLELFNWDGRWEKRALANLFLVDKILRAFATRLFSVLRFESVIHEFDPYFNYRTTRFLAEQGFYNFHNWFDDRAWYPLGRIIGGTIYPGLMVTSAALYRLMWLLNITVDIRNVCVFLAPFFSSLTTLITYALTKEIHSTGAGLVAAAMISIVPGYISRSVAGSYDNEGIAIFCMLLTYYLWIKAVKSGTIFWATMTALAYFYMVSSWGGYVFLINLIPLHVLALMITGRFSHRIYVAYSTLYCVGTILSMQISFVGFQPIQSSEHMLALGVFGLCQIHSFVDYVRSCLSKEDFEVLFKALITTVLSILLVVGTILTITGKVSPWTGRFYSLLDPSYAKNHIPIIASVSEHQPTSWSSFYFDLQILVFLFPAGLYFCFSKLTDSNIFIILYGVTSIYFAGVMVRLMLVLAPVMCVLSGIAVSHLLSKYIKCVDAGSTKPMESRRQHKKLEQQGSVKSEVAIGFVGLITLMLIMYTFHCTWVTSEAYSSPSIVLSARSHDGGRIIFDDFREAYYWLQMNTPEDARIMSWWDYGYQITAMANRTILVDNNTWNNTHISRVGQAMASSEDKAYEIMRELDVDYVLVIFGGLTGYSSDDINKFLWMVRIGGSTDRGAHIKEKDYYAANGEFRVDKEGSPTLLNCLMYKMCYYRFGQVYTEGGKPAGYDRVRAAEIGNKDFELDVLEEAYTTEHWLVRIYKVKDLRNRGV